MNNNHPLALPPATVARSIILIAGVVLLAVSFPEAAVATTINLGGAANYAVLGIGGTIAVQSDFEVYQSATVINGNVGVGPYSTWTHGVDATINGRIDYDTTDSAPTVTGTVTGGVHQIPMADIVADARNASTAAAALAPTQTFATLTSGQTIVGNGGLNVIRVTGDVNLSGGGTTLHLLGGASDNFIFQLTASDAPSAKTLTLKGVLIDLSGGLIAGNVLWDLNGLGGQVVISGGANVPGIFLAPDRGITVDNGIILGSVIGGGGVGDSHSNFVSVHSSSRIIVVPEAGSAILMLLGSGFAARRRSRESDSR